MQGNTIQQASNIVQKAPNRLASALGQGAGNNAKTFTSSKTMVTFLQKTDPSQFYNLW
jgi:hypothetical protein